MWCRSCREDDIDALLKEIEGGTQQQSDAPSKPVQQVICSMTFVIMLMLCHRTQLKKHQKVLAL